MHNNGDLPRAPGASREQLRSNDEMTMSTSSRHRDSELGDAMRRIVVIDDTPDFLALVAVLLETENCKVFMRSVGRNTVGFVKRNRPDVIILDLMLPDADGLEILQHLREDAHTRSIPVIICTAAVDRVRAQRRLLEEANARILEKPFELDALLNAISEATG
ncbi:MAG: response regulator [Chloroflexota bacterium]|nr:MAG: response regulator [Chloroflexota bacterium]